MRPASTSGPYGNTAELYQASGLGSPLPLPPRRKKKPPKGFTGRNEVPPSSEQIEEWGATGARHPVKWDRLGPSGVNLAERVTRGASSRHAGRSLLQDAGLRAGPQ